MNKQRRQMLLGVITDLRLALMDLQEIRDEERDAYENMPEPLQFFHSELKETADAIADEVSALEDIITNLSLIGD